MANLIPDVRELLEYMIHPVDYKHQCAKRKAARRRKVQSLGGKKVPPPPPFSDPILDASPLDAAVP